MPENELKVVLHQDFWRHRRSCVRCGGRNEQTSLAWKNAVCPLEHLIKRPAPKKEPKPATLQTATKPKKAVIKKIPSDEEQMAKGLVKISYEVDDDFDGAGGLTGVMREIWVEDFSKEELVEVVIVEEDDTIYEHIVISKK
ncbi:hypothetical protein EDD36DRAFT_489596 [Exophiala viscosa]|uniref:Uncharacterized protein n=2 Tax=Exophiala viscosa TaxID=2486360 RepID=A0AAN6DRJ5_9EURO|nr:hypothetical protein EDD36DRAFT_489596 [Exophiala viscosa]